MMIDETEIISITSLFYLEMSKNMLSDQEYLILHRVLIEQCPYEIICSEFNVRTFEFKNIFIRILLKIQTISEVFSKIQSTDLEKKNLLKHKISHLLEIAKQQILCEELNINKKISDSSFPVSKKLKLLLQKRNIKTFKELLEIPIQHFPMYAGFGNKSILELIYLIEYEHLEELYDDFSKFSGRYKNKKNPIATL